MPPPLTNDSVRRRSICWEHSVLCRNSLLPLYQTSREYDHEKHINAHDYRLSQYKDYTVVE